MGGASLAAGEDDGLHFFGYGELRLQGCRCRLEGGDAGGDVVFHAVLVEEGHLFLYGTVDARVAGVETHDEEALVVEFFHEGELFFEGHGGGTADGGTGFGVAREFHGDEASGVEDEVGFFEEAFAPDGD